jgi:ankyrin repeat protein
LQRKGERQNQGKAEPGTGKVAKQLISSGADIYAKDDEGRTSFHYQLETGNVEMVRFLADVGRFEIPEAFRGETKKDQGERQIEFGGVLPIRRFPTRK